MGDSHTEEAIQHQLLRVALLEGFLYAQRDRASVPSDQDQLASLLLQVKTERLRLEADSKRLAQHRRPRWKFWRDW